MSEEIRRRIEGEKLLLSYFSYPGCTVCQSLLPKVKTLIDGLSDISFQYINTEENQELAGQHLVFTVPTIVIFFEGREMKRFSRHISLIELQEYLQKTLSLLNNQ